MAAPTGYGYPSPAPRPRRSRARTVLVILAVVVVVILIVGVLAYLLLPSTTVNITEFDFQSPNDVCGLNGATSQGFSANTSETYTMEFTISGNNTTNGGTAACTIATVTTTTSGFSVSSANTPLAIAANSTGDLTFDLSTPGSSFSGPVTLVLT